MCAITFAGTRLYEEPEIIVPHDKMHSTYTKEIYTYYRAIEAHEVYTGSQRHQNEGTKTSEQGVTFSSHKEHFSGHR